MVAGQGRGWAETGEMGEGEVSDHLGFYSSQYSGYLYLFLRPFPLCNTRNIYIRFLRAFPLCINRQGYGRFWIISVFTLRISQDICVGL